MMKLSSNQVGIVRRLYYREECSMREVALKLNVSLNAVCHFMRKHDLPRRTFKEEQHLRFIKKPPTFKISKLTPRLKELQAIGAMLYWGEGYKNAQENSVVDFANSEPGMILLFLTFLRKVYNVDEKRLRMYLYCYSDQNIHALKRYWSRLTGIPQSRFSKPYVRSDFRKDGRKMRYGLLHIRYGDKKLLLEILRLIEYYQHKYASVV